MRTIEMRKLASIKTISEIKSIPNADKICAYRVDGWWVVDSVEKYKIGDNVVYCEIDSWIPTTIAPFLSKGAEPRVFNGVQGERLRTIKLRGQVSQGLLLPLNILTDSPDNTWGNPMDYCDSDVTDILGIQKYEQPVPANLAGIAKGNFPSFIPKTDQERVQNLVNDVAEWQSAGYVFEMTEKLDGSSMTVYYNNGEVGVCSRNLELKEDDSNTFWRVAKSEQLIDKLKKFGRNIALQGELIGEGIQGNRYQIKGQQFHLYDIFDIDKFNYMKPFARRELSKLLDIRHIPVVNETQVLGTGNVDDIILLAEDKSMLNKNTEREGVVYKINGGENISFKAISNKFLLKGGE